MLTFCVDPIFGIIFPKPTDQAISNVVVIGGILIVDGDTVVVTVGPTVTGLYIGLIIASRCFIPHSLSPQSGQSHVIKQLNI